MDVDCLILGLDASNVAVKAWPGLIQLAYEGMEGFGMRTSDKEATLTISLIGKGVRHCGDCNADFDQVFVNGREAMGLNSHSCPRCERPLREDGIDNWIKPREDEMDNWIKPSDARAASDDRPSSGGASSGHPMLTSSSDACTIAAPARSVAVASTAVGKKEECEVMPVGGKMRQLLMESLEKNTTMRHRWTADDVRGVINENPPQELIDPWVQTLAWLDPKDAPIWAAHGTELSNVGSMAQIGIIVGGPKSACRKGRQRRVHIHLVACNPDEEAPSWTKDKQVLIFVEIRKAARDGVNFGFHELNGVILTGQFIHKRYIAGVRCRSTGRWLKDWRDFKLPNKAAEIAAACDARAASDDRPSSGASSFGQPMPTSSSDACTTAAPAGSVAVASTAVGKKEECEVMPVGGKDDERDACDLLGICPGSTVKQINQAFRREARKELFDKSSREDVSQRKELSDKSSLVMGHDVFNCLHCRRPSTRNIGDHICKHQIWQPMHQQSG